MGHWQDAIPQGNTASSIYLQKYLSVYWGGVWPKKKIRWKVKNHGTLLNQNFQTCFH